ncbi:MAG: hypothetical protein WAO20_00075, partial [Acidobacteriota bacterium]
VLLCPRQSGRQTSQVRMIPLHVGRRVHPSRSSGFAGTHYATERPAMVAVLELFRSWGLPATNVEDDDLLKAT